jgi:hypothetical protein
MRQQEIVCFAAHAVKEISPTAFPGMMSRFMLFGIEFLSKEDPHSIPLAI